MDFITYTAEFLDETYGDKLLVMAAMPFMFMLVFVMHEFGHYVAARIFGVQVDRFRIGYGRLIWDKTDRHGTHWRIRILPLAGVVHLLGQRRAELEEMKGGDYDPGKIFCLKPLWQRALIVAAGPLTNILVAFSVFFILFTTVGQPSTPPYITGVEIDSPADKAGFKTGDKVLFFDGQSVERFEQVSSVTRKVADVPFDFVVLRDGRQLELQAASEQRIYRDERGIKRDRARMGIIYMQEPLKIEWVNTFNDIKTRDDPDMVRDLVLDHRGEKVVLGIWSADQRVHDYRMEISAGDNDHLRDPDHEEYDKFYAGTIYGNVYNRYAPHKALSAALQETWRVLRGVFMLPAQLVPLDVENIKSETSVARHRAPLKHDLYSIGYMTALLSIVIALINLLPFPGLDGSFLVMFATEGFVGIERADSIRPYVLRFAVVGFALGVLLAHIDLVMGLIS